MQILEVNRRPLPVQLSPVSVDLTTVLCSPADGKLIVARYGESMSDAWVAANGHPITEAEAVCIFPTLAKYKADGYTYLEPVP